MSFASVEGQDRAVDSLRRALRSGRLHHAFLFAGPDGVGKALTAFKLAEALLCESPTAGEGCGTCRACRRVPERQHPDFHVLERGQKSDGRPEASIRIDQVRALQHDLGFKSYEGGRRVVVILEAERMNPATANALLKTLEEPGPDTHFVLVSAAPHLLLPTILSRCQRVRFAPLHRAVVARHLARLAELEPAAADLLAGLAEGSISKGVALAQSRVLEQRAALVERLDVDQIWPPCRPCSTWPSSSPGPRRTCRWCCTCCDLVPGSAAHPGRRAARRAGPRRSARRPGGAREPGAPAPHPGLHRRHQRGRARHLRAPGNARLFLERLLCHLALAEPQAA
ncbi:MAG: DNA polymerase III subunit delta' [bacterium]